MKFFYIVCALLFLTGAFLLHKNKACLQTAFGGLPAVLEQRLDSKPFDDVVFLYDSQLCNTCPSGETVFRFDNPDTLFVIPGSFSDTDIENFMETFQLQAQVLKADPQTGKYVRRICQCAGSERMNRNIHFRVDASGKVIGKEFL